MSLMSLTVVLLTRGFIARPIRMLVTNLVTNNVRKINLELTQAEIRT